MRDIATRILQGIQLIFSTGSTGKNDTVLNTCKNEGGVVNNGAPSSGRGQGRGHMLLVYACIIHFC